MQTCNRCIGTDAVLDEVMATLTPALKLAGYKIEYNKIEMKTAELARQYQFLSSPTIRVNCRDIFQMVHVGYYIGEKWWHQGATSEALTVLVRFFGIVLFYVFYVFLICASQRLFICYHIVKICCSSS
jgi:hypothetical protein